MKFLEDPVVKEKLASALILQDVQAAHYDAIFYVGGCVRVHLSFCLAKDCSYSRLLACAGMDP